ncbi:MAG TPA: DUF5682 family protein, partial [Phototrophicaceae bacterium]|nr:DUF5682 family protein [Phototrophicaceae bacterium]
MTVHVFGIRHHGPGSARSLLDALEGLQPDYILVEGPPDADDLLPLMMQETMQPPVALLIYNPAQTRQAAYYPFAEFSPEWNALRYGLERAIPTRFMDLPMLYSFPLEQADENNSTSSETQSEGNNRSAVEIDPIHLDPLRALAEAAGYNDSERWWEEMVEQRLNSADLFAAILEAMAALRGEIPPLDSAYERREALREAHMRKTIREAENAG